jgi:hypothetical protein
MLKNLMAGVVSGLTLGTVQPTIEVKAPKHQSPRDKIRDAVNNYKPPVKAAETRYIPVVVPTYVPATSKRELITKEELKDIVASSNQTIYKAVEWNYAFMFSNQLNRKAEELRTQINSTKGIRKEAAVEFIKGTVAEEIESIAPLYFSQKFSRQDNHVMSCMWVPMNSVRPPFEVVTTWGKREKFGMDTVIADGNPFYELFTGSAPLKTRDGRILVCFKA